MATPPTKNQFDTFVSVIREMLVKGDPVELPGVGVLEVRHSPSEIEDQPNGHTIIHPPRDFVHFEPES